MSPCSFWHTEQFCHIFTPVDQLLCRILHKNGPTTYNEHFTAYNKMALVCAGWLHEVQWVLCTALWSMDMTGVYACLFEAVCDVTTVPSHLKKTSEPEKLFDVAVCQLQIADNVVNILSEVSQVNTTTLRKSRSATRYMNAIYSDIQLWTKRFSSSSSLWNSNACETLKAND